MSLKKRLTAVGVIAVAAALTFALQNREGRLRKNGKIQFLTMGRKLFIYGTRMKRFLLI